MVGNLRELIPAFFTGPGGRPLSEEEIARRRQVAGSLLARATDTSPTAGGGASVLAKAIQGLSYGINEGRADRAAAANAEASQANIAAMLGGSGGASTVSAFPPAPSAGAVAASTGGAPDVASTRVEQAHGNGAPVSPVNISGSQQAFIDALLPAAIEESKRTGVDPRIIVAQAAQETGWGRSAPGNNYFGIKSHGKAGGQTFGTHEYVNGKRVNIRDSFRTFDSPADSVRGYGDFLLANPRYKPLMAAQGLDAQLEALQASGYATDPNYSRYVGAIARGIQLPSPSNAVAANEALATGGLDGGLTPAALNSWAEQNYAPGAIDRSALAPVAAPASEVLVAESPEDIAAAELAMNDPAFAGPAVGGEPVAPPVERETQGGAAPQGPGFPGEKRRGADGRMYQYVETSGMAGATGPWGWIHVADSGASPAAPEAVPQPSVQAIQALTAMPVNDALPMAGSVDNPRPIVPTAPQNPMQGLNPAVVQALSNPNSTQQERSVAQALLQQHVAQNQALQEQARKQAEQANMLAQRRGLAGRMGIDPNYAVDDTIWKAATEANFRDPASYSAGSYIRNSDGTLDQVPLNPTGDIQNYEYYARKELEAGRVPLSPLEYEQALRRSGATNITNTVGGQEMTPGWKKIDEGFGDTYLSWQAGGWADNKKQVAQLRESLGRIQKAAREGRNISGIIGALPESLQPFINPEGTIAREGVEEVVQRSLREILGAQFTEREGERLIARAYNPRLLPAENAKRVERLLEQVERMGEARQSMVDYFDQNGTLRGYKGNKPSMSSLDSLDREWSKQDGDTGGKIPDGIDPSDWEFMTPEERRLFQ